MDDKSEEVEDMIRWLRDAQGHFKSLEPPFTPTPKWCVVIMKILEFLLHNNNNGKKQ